MDDLWGPPNYQATEEMNFVIDGCCCPYCLNYDEIEEQAKNEKSCIQVLSRLINKADTDITELEKELLDLVTELAYTEKEFSNMFCMDLNRKIKMLDISIGQLKGGARDFLSISKEPAESIDDMLKSVFHRYSQKKSKQFAEKTNNVSTPNNQVLAVNLPRKRKQLDRSSNDSQMEKSKRMCITPEVKLTVLQTRVKLEVEDADYPASLHDFLAPSFNNLHCTSLVPKYSPLGLCQGAMNTMNNGVYKLQLKSPVMTKDNLPNTTAKGLTVCQNSSSKTQGKRKHQLKNVSSQPEDESICSTSICLVKSSQDSNVKHNTIKELGFPLGNSSTEDQKEPRGSLSPILSSTKTYRRRERISSVHKNSNPPLLLEGPKLLCTIGVDVDNPHDPGFYTVDDLKAIARKRNLKGYYKLRKAELAQLLGITITEGKRKKYAKDAQSVLLIEAAP